MNKHKAGWIRYDEDGACLCCKAAATESKAMGQKIAKLLARITEIEGFLSEMRQERDDVVKTTLGVVEKLNETRTKLERLREVEETAQELLHMIEREKSCLPITVLAKANWLRTALAETEAKNES